MRAYLIRGLEVFVVVGAVVYTGLWVIQGIQNNGVWGAIFGFVVGAMSAAIIFGALATLLDIREQAHKANKLLERLNSNLAEKDD